MKQIEIVTETKTRVTYDGKDVNDILSIICSNLHEILYDCSYINDKIDKGVKITHDDVINIEGSVSEMLDMLGD